jgi:selenoprotein W-related protein
LADRLKEEFDVDSELIKGGGGIFDVKVDGKLVYSKHQTGEFPNHEALVTQIHKLATA